MILRQSIVDEARAQRTLAEQTADPEQYEKAAALFDAVGMAGSAARCRERAAWYADQAERAPATP